MFPTPIHVFPQSSNQTADLHTQVRVMQIIVAALMMGVLMFAGVASFLVFSTEPQRDPKPEKQVRQPQTELNAPQDAEQELPLIAIFGGVMAGITIPLRFILPNVIVQKQIREMFRGRPIESVAKTDFVSIYQVSLIIASALLEGAALFNIVALIIDRQVWSLRIAGVLVALIGAGFPTVERVDAWTEEQLRNLQLNSV